MSHFRGTGSPPNDAFAASRTRLAAPLAAANTADATSLHSQASENFPHFKLWWARLYLLHISLSHITHIFFFSCGEHFIDCFLLTLRLGGGCGCFIIGQREPHDSPRLALRQFLPTCTNTSSLSDISLLDQSSCGVYLQDLNERLPCRVYRGFDPACFSPKFVYCLDLLSQRRNVKLSQLLLVVQVLIPLPQCWLEQLCSHIDISVPNQLQSQAVSEHIPE